MIEFLLIFAITCVILCALAAAMYFGRPPVYSVSRLEALGIINALIAGQLPELKWLVFIGHAIPGDPELNEIRLECSQLELLAEIGDQVAYSANAKRYNQAGLDQLRLVVEKLEKLIEQTPVYKEF